MFITLRKGHPLIRIYQYNKYLQQQSSYKQLFITTDHKLFIQNRRFT